MRILVTGATGFIGKARLEHLTLNKHDVIAIGNQHTDKVAPIQANIDVSEKDALSHIVSRFRPDRIEHFASQSTVSVSRDDPWSTYRTNVLGAVSTFEVAKRFKIPVLAFTTDKYYGNREVSHEDDSPIICSGAYESSKTCQDIIAQSYQLQGANIKIVRSCNVFGASDYNSRIIPNTLRALKEGRRPIVFNNVIGLRQYIYIKDLMSGLDKILDSDIDVCNIGTEIVKSQKDVVEKLVELWNTAFETDHVPIYEEAKNIAQTSEIKSQYLDWTRLKTIGWKPSYTFEHAIAEIMSLDYGAVWNITSTMNNYHQQISSR